MHLRSQNFRLLKCNNDSSCPFLKRFLASRLPQCSQYFSGSGFLGIGICTASDAIILQGFDGRTHDRRPAPRPVLAGIVSFGGQRVDHEVEVVLVATAARVGTCAVGAGEGGGDEHLRLCAAIAVVAVIGAEGRHDERLRVSVVARAGGRGQGAGDERPSVHRFIVLEGPRYSARGAVAGVERLGHERAATVQVGSGTVPARAAKGARYGWDEGVLLLFAATASSV